MFAASGQMIRGVNKKGKDFFKLVTNLTEPIRNMRVEDTKIWTGEWAGGAGRGGARVQLCVRVRVCGGSGRVGGWCGRRCSAGLLVCVRVWGQWGCGGVCRVEWCACRSRPMFTAGGELILNVYDDGRDVAFFMCPDVINHLCIQRITRYGRVRGRASCMGCCSQ